MFKQSNRKIKVFGAVVFLIFLSIGPVISIKVNQTDTQDDFIYNTKSNVNLNLKRIIIVPDDYPTIQAAINAASDGDVIEVKEGTYNENIEINKLLKIKGHGYRHTFIDGGGADDTVKILRDGVEISFFTIRNSCLDCAGIYVDSHYNIITMNIITENGYGIYLDSSNGNIIKDNLIHNNHKNGIQFYASHMNDFLKNEVKDNGQDGMKVDFSSTFNNLNGNIAADNEENGTIINDASRSNTFVGNKIAGNTVGVLSAGASDSNLFHHNAFQFNDENANDSSDDIWNGLNKGNHWEDYTGEDLNGDGIGDTPYIIAGGNNQDNFPLIVTPLPGKPVIEGPTSVRAGVKTEYHIYTPEAERIYDDVFYEVYWDNGSPWEKTSEMVNTTEGTNESHTWNIAGVAHEKKFVLTAKAIVDFEGVEVPSDISDPLVVTVKSRNHCISNDKNDIHRNILFFNDKKSNFDKDCDIIVPRDFSTIQEAIDNANNGATICVWDGIYEENILISGKTLSIVGNSSYNCIIKGDHSENCVVTIEHTNNVNFTGFHITDGYNGGIWLENTTGCKIQDNFYGSEGSNSLLIFYSEDTTITNNEFYECGLGIYGNKLEHFIQTVENNFVNGLELYYAKNENTEYLWGEDYNFGSIILVNCTNFVIDSFENIKNTFSAIEIAYCSEIDIKASENLTNNEFGIYVYNCLNDINIFNNNISNNEGYGIYARKSTVKIYDNVIHNNNYGIGLWESVGNHIENNILYENSQSGIYLHFSHYNEIGRDNLIHKNVNGINILSSDFNLVHNNTIRKNSYDGIFLKNASNNTIIWNKVEHNAFEGSENNVRNGIELKEKSCCNRIEYNFISYQKFWGVMIYDNSNNNKIFHNTFFFNGFFWDFVDRHAFDSCTNIWDNGYPEDYEDFSYEHGYTKECGNCWSHFLTIDLMKGPFQNIPDVSGDNVSDASYQIPGGNNIEKYPIMQFFPDDNEPPELYPIFPNPGFLHIAPFINWDWPLQSTYVIFLKIGENSSLLKLKFKVNAFEPHDMEFQSNLVRVNFTLTHHRTQESITSGWINYDPFGPGYEWDLTGVPLFGRYKLNIIAKDTAGNEEDIIIDPIYIFNFIRTKSI